MTYSLSQVTQLTDIKAHTLRVWERRYDFLVAKRKSSGARVYSEDEVKQLLNVKILLSSGFRISKIAQMSSEEVFIEVQRVYSTNDADDEVFVQSLIKSMLDFDEILFDEIFEKLKTSKGLFESLITVIYPFLRRVGGLWLNDKILPINEHFISNLIRQKLIAAIEELPLNVDKKKRVILFLPESEDHEIALLLSHFLFKSAGWQVIYLGLRVPIENLHDLIKKMKCQYGLTFIQIPQKELVEALSKIFLKHPSFTLLLSGTKTSLEDLIVQDQCTYLENPHALVEFLEVTNNVNFV